MDKIQEVYRSQSVAINDKHIETICRQMLRSVRVTRVGDTDFLVDEQVDRFRFMEENEKVINRPAALRAAIIDRRARRRNAALARHHEGVAVDRFVHFGGVVPGDHACVDGSRNRRPSRLPARPEGKRHRRTPDPGRNPTLEDLLQRDEEEALSLADFEDEQ